jgi:hypothetical protein
VLVFLSGHVAVMADNTSTSLNSRVVAYPDRTAFLGGYFRVGGDSTGTRKPRTGRSMSALAIWRKTRTLTGHQKGLRPWKSGESWYSTGIPSTTPK